MTDDLQLLRRVRPQVAPPSQEVKAAARRSLDQTVAARGARRRPRVPWVSGAGVLIPALGALVVVVVVVLFVGLHTQRPASTSGGQTGLRLVFGARQDVPSHPVNAATMERLLLVVRHRLDTALPGASVVSHGDELTVTTRSAIDASAAEVAAVVAGHARLLFYDWEANALTPSGRPVAELLQSKNPAAVEISQGSASAPAGAPGPGSLPLYRAVWLSSRQRRWTSPTNSRLGAEYFVFGRPGSAACALAARYYHSDTQGQECYLAGPRLSRRSVEDALPPGVSPPEQGIHVLAVPQGWVVLRAVPQSFGRQLAWSDPAGRYYVLRDNVALSSQNLMNAHQSADETGAPDVTFGFTPLGGRQFQNLTAQLARRGQLVSGLGQKVYQHFAVAVGTQLITVPYIDYNANPDGIPGNNGADIQGGFTIQTARALAAEITPLPASLQVVSVSGR